VVSTPPGGFPVKIHKNRHRGKEKIMNFPGLLCTSRFGSNAADWEFDLVKRL